MHYRNTAFSKNGEPTLKSLHFPDLKFGQRKMFSQGDITQINQLYSCNLREENRQSLKKGPTMVRIENDGDVIPNTFDNLHNSKESYFNF